MSDLIELYRSLGYLNVSSYIQSGNIIFDTLKITDSRIIETDIEKAILAKFGFEVPVFVRSISEFEITHRSNPFLVNQNIDTEKLHVTFLSELPSAVGLQKLSLISFLPDDFKITGRDIYIYCPGGYGKTRLSNIFFENQLKVSATTRNWKTVSKLLELALQ